MLWCWSSVRVSNELGAGNPKSAAFSVIIVNIYSLITSVILAIVILACRDFLSYAFTEGKKVSAAVSDLFPLLALTLVLNGIQPVLSGIVFLFITRNFTNRDRGISLKNKWKLSFKVWRLDAVGKRLWRKLMLDVITLSEFLLGLSLGFTSISMPRQDSLLVFHFKIQILSI